MTRSTHCGNPYEHEPHKARGHWCDGVGMPAYLAAFDDEGTLEQDREADSSFNPETDMKQSVTERAWYEDWRPW